MRRGAPAVLLAFLLPFAIYAATRAPDLTFVDAGELAAAASTLGIAHPTGYPLFTLLGRTLVALPGPLEPFARLNLLSSACAAAASALVMLSVRRILLALGHGPAVSTPTALAASLTLAAGRTVWNQAVIVEVYALHLLFVALLVYCLLRVAEVGEGEDTKAEDDGMRPLLLTGFIAGLAIGNHLSAALLLPAIAFGVVRERGVQGLMRAAPIAVVLFVIGLSIYLYLPVRSALDPMLDWGNPETPGAFLRHSTGAVYRVWFLSSPEVAVRQLGRFFSLLSVEMTPIALVPAVLGLVHLWRQRPSLAHTTVLLLLLNLLSAVNYDIHDVDAYFLPAFLVVALWVGVGIGSVLEALLEGRRRRSVPAAPRWAAALALPAFAFAWNAGASNQRDNHLVGDYTAAMFRSLDPKAVILSRQWDHFCSASIYVQLVRGEHRDVTVLEKELLRRSWYLEELERWDPELIAGCRAPIEAFKAELVPFETGGRYRSDALQERYVEMINCLLEHASATRPTYLTPDALEPGIARSFIPVPVGLALRLYRELPSSPPPSPLIEIRGLKEAHRSEEDYPRQLAELVLDMTTRRAVYLATVGRFGEALAAIDRVLAIDPIYPQALELRAAIRPRFPAGGSSLPPGPALPPSALVPGGGGDGRASR